MRGMCESDGYELHYERVGQGSRIVWVDPALGSSAMRPLNEVVAKLAERFEVVTYDRRGRGVNSDALGSSPGQEVADLAALVTHVGGAAAVVGFSSGGALVLRAAAELKAASVVLLEPAIDAEPDAYGLRQVIADALSRGDGDAAAKAFYAAVGVPEEILEDMVGSEAWPHVVRSAGTLLADIDLSVVDDDVIATVSQPAHVIVSTGSPQEIVDMGEQIARRLGADLWREPGSWHGVDGNALAERLAQLIDLRN